MRLARSIGALLLGGAGLLAAAPLAAAQAATGGWTSPAPRGEQGGIPVAYVEGPQSLNGYAAHPDGIVAVTFRLERDAESRPDHPCSAWKGVPAQTAPGGSAHVDFSFDASFPCNSRYLVRATATPGKGAGPLVLDLWVAVAIPPATVTGVTASPGAGSVELRWASAEHEADFQGYEIRRSVGDGPFEAIGDEGADATTFVDDDPPAAGGRIRYQVVGMRPGPEAGTTVFSRGGSPVEVELPGETPGGEADGGDDEGDDDGAGSGSRTRTGSVNLPTGGGSRSVTRSVPARPRTTTTLDTGYEEALPFRQSEDVEPGGDPAVVARFAGDEEDTQRQSMLLVAGGATAISWGMVLRFVLRRAAI